MGKMDYFIMHGVIQEDGELVFNSPNSDGKYVIQYIGQNHKTPWVTGSKRKAHGLTLTLLVLSGPAPCFYLAAVPSSRLTVKE